MNRTLLKDYKVGDCLQGHARIITKRNLGGISFWGVRYNEELVQLVLKKGETEDYQQAKKILPGSIIFFNGHKYISNQGEHSVLVSSITAVAPCFQSLPEKFHGLSQEHRYKMRAIELMCRAETFDLFKAISQALCEIRMFLYSLGYREFITGVLQKQFEGGQSHSFSTLCNANGERYHLSMTSELKLKRLLAAGFDRAFEIAQSFRNEGIDASHSPEFSLLEMYASGSSCSEMMDLTEQMVRKVVIGNSSDGSCIFTDKNGQQVSVSFEKPFERITFKEACQRYIDLGADCQLERLAAELPELFHLGMNRFTWVMKVIEKMLVPNMVNPTFLTEIPAGLSPFVKVKPGDEDVSERAFFVAHNLAIADISTDENEFNKVKVAWQEQAKETGSSAGEDFMEILRFGIPQTAGVGMSLNRLFMLFLGTLPRNVKETILYPIV
jgi:lysyl-tRNA synthetase class 2